MSTIYEKTDNYALNLYGDNDPADLRDGYNGSMRTIDTTLENHLNRIEAVESRETHDEEVVKALIGDNTVDSATAAKTKWDKASTDATAANGKADSNTGKINLVESNIQRIEGKTDFNAANLTALHADTVENAGLLYNKVNKNYAIYAESIGCKSEPGYDNATILNNYLKTHANTTLIFSNGDYEFQTPLDLLSPGNIITEPDSWLVYTGAQTETFITIEYAGVQNSLPSAQKYIAINADVNGLADTGIHVKASRGVTLYLTVCNATGTGVHWEGSGHLAVLYASAKNRYGQKSENVTSSYGNVGLLLAGYDALLSYIVTTDYAVGIRETGSNNHVVEAHPWGAAPNSVGIELNTSGTMLVDNFVEDSSVVMFSIVKGTLTVKNIAYPSTYNLRKLFVLGDSDATKLAAIDLSGCVFNQSLLDDIAWTIGNTSINTMSESNVGTMLHGKSGIDLHYDTVYLPGKYVVNKETVKDLTGQEATTFGQLKVINSAGFVTYILFTEFGIYTNTNKGYFKVPKTNWNKLA